MVKLIYVSNRDRMLRESLNVAKNGNNEMNI